MKFQFRYCFIIFAVIASFSCKKSVQNPSFIYPSDIFPLQIGKVYFYRFDSILPINFGKDLQTRTYIAKDSVESSFIDQLGNPSYRIYRYMTDTLKSIPWFFVCTNVATINSNGNIEYIENNLRYTKLANPINTSYAWKGNSYINTKSPSPYTYLDDWDYRYTNLAESFTSLKATFDTTYTVIERQDSTKPIFDPQTYYSKTVSKAVYAKNVGLIYKDFLYFIWQPPVNGNAGKYQDDSWGIKMNLIDYK